MMNKPYIHLFKLGKNILFVYDVNTNTCLKINEESYNCLLKGTDKVNEQLKIIKESGFLNENNIMSICHSKDAELVELLNNSVESISLQVTQNCNLNCSYCAFSGSYINRKHQNKRMTEEDAIRGVNFLLKHSKNNPRINIGFYGGEPLLEFPLIKNVIEYINKNVQGKEITYSITTNGTLIDKNMIEFFYKNSVALTISLDGPEQIHNLSRITKKNEGTYEIVKKNILMIKKYFPQYFKMITYNAVMQPKSDYISLTNYFENSELIYKDNYTLSFISELYSKESINYSKEFNQNYEYDRFILFMNKASLVSDDYVSKPMKAYEKQLKELLSNEEGVKQLVPKIFHHSGPCVPGVLKLFINVDGNFYPCESISEASKNMIIGNLDEGFNTKKIREVLNIGKLTEEYCKKCWAIRLCTQCAAYSDDMNKFSKDIKLKECQKVKFYAEEKLKDYCMMKYIEKYKGDI